MKKHRFWLLGIALAFLTSLECNAELKTTVDGQELFFAYESFGLNYNAVLTSSSTPYSGVLNIPSSVVDQILTNTQGKTYTVVGIGSAACKNCTALTKVYPPYDSYIESNAFYGCTKLNYINLKYVKRIDEYAFYGCSSLTSVTLGSSISKISKNTFEGCTYLSNITFNLNLKSIENYAFKGCSNLTSIAIPSNVTTIGTGAFQGCSKLTSVSIPAAVSTIGANAFQGCTGITQFIVTSGNASYASMGGVLFNNDKSQLIQYPIGNVRESYTLPKSVTRIKSNAFSGAENLTSISVLTQNPADIQLENGAFGNIASQCTLYVPRFSKHLYENTAQWKNFKEIIEIDPIIENNQFYADDLNIDKDIKGNETFYLLVELN